MKRVKQSPEIMHSRVKLRALCETVEIVLRKYKAALKKNMLVRL